MGNQKMKVCFAFLFVLYFSLGEGTECGNEVCADFGVECCNEFDKCVPANGRDCPQVCNKNTGKMCNFPGFGLCCKNNNRCGECQRSFKACPCRDGTVFKNGTCCNANGQCAECDPGPWMKNNGSVEEISTTPPPSTEGCQCPDGKAYDFQKGMCCNMQKTECVNCPSSQTTDCHEGWELQGDFCYKHIGVKKTWDMAWHWCQDKENAHLASILSKEDDCFVFNLTTGSGKGNTEKFWLDGIFIIEFMPNMTSTSELGEKFIWTDGSKMEYKNWNKISRVRNCSQGDDCPPGEPQQSDTNLCLHGGVNEIRAPVQQREVATDDHCTTWGNQESCTKKLPFVCKRAKGQKFDDSIIPGSRF